MHFTRIFRCPANEAVKQERVVLVSSLHHKSSVQPEFPDNTLPLITHYRSLSLRYVEHISTVKRSLNVLTLEIQNIQVLYDAGLTGPWVLSWETMPAKLISGCSPLPFIKKLVKVFGYPLFLIILDFFLFNVLNYQTYLWASKPNLKKSISLFTK